MASLSLWCICFLVSGQWSMGPSAFLSLDDSGKDDAFGFCARSERRVAPRWSVLVNVGFAVPENYKYDFTSAARGNLASGIPPNTRYKGHSVTNQLVMDLGILRRIGGTRRGYKAPHAYWGFVPGLGFRTISSAVDITDVPSSSSTHVSGIHQAWSVTLSPIFGFRSGGAKGRWIVEVMPVLVNDLSDHSSSWWVRYQVRTGYLWNLGD